MFKFNEGEMTMMRITEAAREIGVSATTLRRWTRRGLVPSLKSPGNQRYFTDDQIREIRRAMATRART
jgi:excisionase family DNA binding protein